jgi:hypothetical protein
MARVDVGDAGAERDLARGLRERLAERQTVARARTVEPREAFLLETLRHLERRATAPGDRDETDGRFGGHLREYSRSHYDRRTQKEEIS